MNHPCPDCNTDLTPSIVGYLCSNCGAVHSFQKVNDAVHSGGNLIIENNNQDTELNQKGSQEPPKGVKHKIKNFVVPKIAELPKPIDESHLLENHPIEHSNGIDESDLSEQASTIPHNETRVEDSTGQTNAKKSNSTKIIIILASITLLAIIGSIIVLVLSRGF